MPKNIFFMSFLYVFIACVMFVAVSVHSQPARDMTPQIAAAGSYANAGNGHLLHYACSPWYRK